VSVRRAPGGDGIAVLYPGEGEVVGDSRCRFLIEAPERRVEIAIDGEGWSSCRLGGGYWWFDRAGLAPGHHQALIRCEGPDGREPSQRTLRFLVAPGRANA
jgi:hypothetical protein